VARLDRAGIWCGRDHRSVDTVVEETCHLSAMWGMADENRWDVGLCEVCLVPYRITSDARVIRFVESLR